MTEKEKPDTFYNPEYKCPWCGTKCKDYDWFLHNHDCNGYYQWRKKNL